ncbi:MAG: hypothetical protein QG641_1342 [Candidatus Poribacteria bacterium]|nr:hypothetical protein [Candidatus Poribacteria bacterium]
MRLRALFAGILAVIALGIAIPTSDFLHIGTHIAHTFMPIGPIFLFFVFVLLFNLLMKVFRIGFTRHELLLIYSMMTIACGFGPGCLEYLIPSITAPFYYASPENNYEILLQYIPRWLSPGASNGSLLNPILGMSKVPDNIKYLYEGLPGWVAFPWKDWILPFFSWTLLILAVVLVDFCLAIIVRKQWFENERLAFPLAQIPVEMVKDESGTGSLIPSFFKNRVLWIAFAIPFIIYSLRGLHFYFPKVPDPGGILMVWLSFPEKPWNALTNVFLQTVFTTIGLTYFVPSAVSFSVWFLFLFFQFQIIIGTILGFRMQFSQGEAFNRAFIDYQVIGGIIVFAILLAWSMKKNLRDMFLVILKKQEGYGSQRLAILGLLIGFIFICIWGVFAGAKLWSVIFYFLVFFAIVTVVSRLAVEAGLFYVGYKIFPLEIMLPFTGTSSLGNAGITTFVLFNQGIQREFRVDTMTFFLNNMKMGEIARLKTKSLNFGMWLAIPIGLFVAGITVIGLMYKYGGVNVGEWWTVNVPRDITCKNATRYITSPLTPDVNSIFNIFIGGCVTVFLFIMRRLFFWWPFHPIGYVMAGSYSITHVWWSTFIGWLAKILALRFGGLRVYQKLRPFFIGLVLGECIIIGTWVVIDLILGTKGNFLFWL